MGWSKYLSCRLALATPPAQNILHETNAMPDGAARTTDRPPHTAATRSVQWS